jgi:hypothetical protein
MTGVRPVGAFRPFPPWRTVWRSCPTVGTVVLSEGTHRVGAPCGIHRDVHDIGTRGGVLTVVAFEEGGAPASGFAMAGATYAVKDLALRGNGVRHLQSWGGRLDITR